MATTKLFYQQPLGGEIVYDKTIYQCITVEDTWMYIISIEDQNFGNGAVFLDGGDKDDNRYLRFSDIAGCAYKVQLTPTGSASFWVAGQTVTVNRKIYNPFNYKLNSPQLKLYIDTTSATWTPVTTSAAVSNINANSSTTISTMSSFTVPSPDIIGSDLFNIMSLCFNRGNGDPTGSLITSGNTDLGKNITAYPMVYFSSDCPLARPILMRPYIVMTRSGSGNVNSGATVTMTCKVYNRNDGKTSASGGTYSLQKVKVRLTLSGSGFSGNAGTIAWNGSSSQSYVEATGITISRTTNQNSPSYTTVTFTYTAPSTTTQGTVTITPSVTDWYYGSSYAFTSYPETGNTVQITVNAAGPVTHYFPFRILSPDGKSYLTRSDLEAYAEDLPGLYMYLGNQDAKGEWDDSIPYTQWNILSGYNTIWYVSSTIVDTLPAYGAYATSMCDEITFPEFDSEYDMPTTASYSAFNSAGIYDGSFATDICIAIGCEGNEIWLEEVNGAVNFKMEGYPCSTADTISHLYIRVSLYYQNSGYEPQRSRYRTLIFDVTKQWSYDGMSYSNTSYGGDCGKSAYSYQSTTTAISDTWGLYFLSTADLQPDDGWDTCGNAYIDGLKMSYSSSGTWVDASLGAVNPGNRYNSSFEFSGYDPSGMLSYGPGNGYAWYELCPVFTNPCTAYAVEEEVPEK